jgi:hypothetical protein
MFNEEDAHPRFALALRGYDPEEVEVALTELRERAGAALVGERESIEARALAEDELGAFKRALAEAMERISALEQVSADRDPDEPLTLEELGQSIAEILRTANDQARQIRSKAEGSAEMRASEAEAAAASVLEEAQRRAVEMRLAVADEAAATRAEAHHQVEAEFDDARTEVRRLTDAAALEEADARQLRAEAEHDRQLAADALTTARHEGMAIVEAACESAVRQVDELSAERDLVLGQLVTISAGLAELLAVASESSVTAESTADTTISDEHQGDAPIHDASAV